MTKLNIVLQNPESIVAGKDVVALFKIFAGGNLVGFADISVDTDSTGSVEYDGDGNPMVTIDEVEPGSIEVTASKEGYEEGILKIPVPEAEPEDEPPEEEPEEEPPEIPEPDEPQEEPEEPRTPICDALFFGGQTGLSKDQRTLNAIKAEVFDLENSSDPLAEEKLAAGREAATLLEAHLQEKADRDEKIRSADEKAKEANAKGDNALEQVEILRARLEAVLEGIKGEGGVYFI